MSQNNWDADKMLDIYIYDYMMKRKLLASAQAFQSEGNVSTEPVAIDAPGGFLFEWWSVFWDIFIARTNERHSEAAASYIEAQVMKARELQQQQRQHIQKPQPNAQAQMQQLLLIRQAQQQKQQQQQQQQRDSSQLLSSGSGGIVGNDALMRQNPATANVLATKMYEERLKLPHQKDSLNDASLKQKLSENVSQLLDPNQASMLKAAVLACQPPGQALQGTSGGISGVIQGQSRSQQLPGSQIKQELKSEMDSILNSRPAVPEGSSIGVYGSNQGNSSNLTLKGWPLTGLDQLRSGLLQPSKSLMQSTQSLNQLPLQQQILLHQAQQNLASPSGNELESRRLRMVLNNPNMGLIGKDGQINSSSDLPNAGSAVQVGCPVFPRGDPEMLIKQQLQNYNQQQQQYLQHPLSSQQSQKSSHQLQQQDKMISTGSLTADGSMSNAYQGTDQASKNNAARKRKQPVSSSGPANSTGTANTTGPSPSSPSTPSTHTPGDVMSMPSLPHNGGSSKSLLMFGSDGLGSLTSVSNQLAEIERFVDDGTLEDNVESFLSQDESDQRDRAGQSADKGFTFLEVRFFPVSSSKVECCHFSPDGKLLATGGHDRKAILWCMESFTMKSTLEEHTQYITDVRFSSSMARLATSSADKTVRVWDADNPGYSLRTFTGHSSTVMSLDFHPSKEDLVCSCDSNSEIRYWSVKNGSCAGVFKGGATQIRFQPHHGRILAAASENYISILDVEAQLGRLKLQGHKSPVHSVCWNPSGEYLASVSDDSVKVWTGNNGECIHELSCTGNKFSTCVFHPTYPSVLVIGCNETLELWHMTENKKRTLHAHEKLVSALAASNATGLVASASYDKCVKLWK